MAREGGGAYLRDKNNCAGTLAEWEGDIPEAGVFAGHYGINLL